MATVTPPISFQEQSIGAGGWRLFARDSTGELVGRAFYSLVDDKCHLSMIWVHPTCRRQGIGTSIIAHIRRQHPDRSLIGTVESVEAVPVGALRAFYRQAGAYFTPRSNRFIFPT